MTTTVTTRTTTTPRTTTTNRTTIGVTSSFKRDCKLRFSSSKRRCHPITVEKAYYNPFAVHTGIRRSTREDCTVCLSSEYKIYSCPSSKNCTGDKCIHCIEYYADLTGSCSCSTCGYVYTIGDLILLYGRSVSDSALFDYKMKTYWSMYDKYLPRTARRLAMARRLADMVGVSVDDEQIGKLLLSSDDYIQSNYIADVDHLYQDIWRDLLQSEEDTKVVDRCKNCHNDIVEVSYSRVGGAADYTTYDCVHCTNRLCKSCGVVYDRTRQFHRCTRDDIKSFRSITSNSKKCPTCYVYVVKSDGCDDMWCTSCGTTFDWETGNAITQPRHNPEHTDFLVRLYDGISLRSARHGFIEVSWYRSSYISPANDIARNHFKYTYDEDHILEKAVLSNIVNHILDVIDTIMDIDDDLQEATEIHMKHGEDIRIAYLLDNDREKYNTAMRKLSMGMFYKRYVCSLLQEMRVELIKRIRILKGEIKIKGEYTAEYLYKGYCLVMANYIAKIESIHKYLPVDADQRIDLYRLIYEDSKRKSYSYYDRNTGVIIPCRYTIYNKYVSDRIPQYQKDIIKRKLDSYTK